MVNKDVEGEMTLHDGYLLKPGTFDEMLPKGKSTNDGKFIVKSHNCFIVGIRLKYINFHKNNCLSLNFRK
jgi:hypothetical protein